MVTSSAVVGSSAMSSVGPVQQRDRDGDALAHAAGELVRIGVAAARRARGCRRGRAPRGSARAPPSRETSLVRRGSPRSSACRCAAPDSASSSGPGRSSRCGCRAACASSSSAQADELARRRSGCEPADDAARRVDEAEDRASPVTDLPEPDSPTSPSTSPRSTREADAVDGRHDARAREEVRPQILRPRGRRRSSC